jgi:hypothetical protein
MTGRIIASAPLSTGLRKKVETGRPGIASGESPPRFAAAGTGSLDLEQSCPRIEDVREGVNQQSEIKRINGVFERKWWRSFSKP